MRKILILVCFLGLSFADVNQARFFLNDNQLFSHLSYFEKIEEFVRQEKTEDNLVSAYLRSDDDKVIKLYELNKNKSNVTDKEKLIVVFSLIKNHRPLEAESLLNQISAEFKNRDKSWKYAEVEIALQKGDDAKFKKMINDIKNNPSEDVSIKERYLLLDVQNYYRKDSFQTLELSESDYKIPLVRYYLAWDDFSKNRYEEAKTIFTELLGKDALNASVKERILYGLLLIDQMEGKFEKVVSKSQSLIDNENLSSQLKEAVLFLNIEANFNLNYYGIVEIKIKDFITNYSDSTFISDLSYYLGIIYYRDRKYEEALKTFEKARENSYFVYRANYYMAQAYYNLKKYKEAINFYKKVKGNYYNFALYGLGWAYFEYGDYQNALNAFSDVKTTEIKDSKYSVEFKIADSYYNLKKYQMAVNKYLEMLNDKSLSKDKEYEVRIALSNSYQRLRKYQEAGEVLKKYAEKYPDNKKKKDLLLLMSEYNFRNKQYFKAIEQYNELLNLNLSQDDKQRVVLNMASSYFNLNEYAKALNIYNDVEDEIYDSNNKLEVLNGKLESLMGLKKYKEARDCAKLIDRLSDDERLNEIEIRISRDMEVEKVK